MPSPSTTALIHFSFPANISLRERTRLKTFIAALFRREKTPLAEIQYVFCTDRYLLDINRQYLQHDYYTDIITFDLSDPDQPINAEIYISVDRVRENALEFNSSVQKELHRVIFHGALHLCGYTDKGEKAEKEMRKMEDKYLNLYFKR
jgi:probable rRNA maturation factor